MRFAPAAAITAQPFVVPQVKETRSASGRWTNASPVTVFEREPSRPQDPHASTFHPPTLDMLDGYGLGAPPVERSRVTPTWQIRLHETGERAMFDLAVLREDTGHPYRLQCEQQVLQELLLERIETMPNVDLRCGMRVDAVGQDERGIWAEVRSERIAGSYLIGADGAHSLVREYRGFGFDGETYPETTILVTTDFPFEQAIEGLSGVNYVWAPDGTFNLLRLPGLWRCSFYPRPGEPIEEALGDDSIEHQLQSVVPRPERYSVLHRRSYRIHPRVVARYRVGRMLLAGDAAHLNSPSGGMGMNGGIHDAFNLADELSRVLSGADPELLDLYERQRRTVAIEDVIAHANRNRRRMRETDSMRRRVLLAELQRAAADPQLARQHLLQSSMLAGLRRAATIS